MKRMAVVPGFFALLLILACTARPTSTPPTPTVGLALATQTPATIGMRTTATPAPSPTPTATPLPTPTPVPQPRQLTSDPGCCWSPFFLDDGRVAFLDKPAPEAPTGYYAVPLTGGTPELIETRIGYYLGNGRYFVFWEGEQVVIEDRRDGTQYRPPTEGRSVSLLPDGEHIVWSVRDSDSSIPFDQRITRIWQARLDGSEAREVLRLQGGGVVALLPDGTWLLERTSEDDETVRVLERYNAATGERIERFRAARMRSERLSPDGRWLLFFVAQDRVRERNGMWLLPLDGGTPQKLPWFGAYAWEDEDHILYLPFQPSAESHQVRRYTISTGTDEALTDPAQTRFKIAQNNLAFAPDRSGLVYVSATDLNLYWLPLATK